MAGATVDRLIISIAAVLIAASAAVWVPVVRRVRSGQPIVPCAARRRVPWRFGDLYMIAAFYLLANAAFYGIGLYLASIATGKNEGNRWQRSANFEVMTGASIAGNVAATGFGMLWLFLNTGATWSDLGWRRETIARDVRLGLWSFAVVAAPIYGLHARLAPLTEKQHPIIEALSDESTPVRIVLGGISAVVVAPFAEEFFFRVILQGWLESFGTTTPAALTESREPTDHTPWPGAVLIAALIFALLHLDHGTAPIPLFFLALALGYLYQRTHRLLPSVTVHFCLNAFSYAALCLSQAK